MLSEHRDKLETLKNGNNFVLEPLEHKEISAQRSRFLVSFALIDLAWCTITVILCSNACNNDQSSPMKMCFRTFYEALIVKKTFENTNS